MTETWGPWRDLARRLVDTQRCPDCGVGLERPVCHRCGLDLRVGRAHDVRRLSFELADLLNERIELIADMREAQARRARVQPAPQPEADVPTGPRLPAEPGPRLAAAATGGIPAEATDGLTAEATDGLGAPAGATRRSDQATSPGTAQAPSHSVPGRDAVGAGPGAPGSRTRLARPKRAPRRDISLQPILAGAGALLLAVAAVVFVFFTFGDDLTLRAVVTGIVTVAAAGVAGFLRRGGLRTTSEAVAALAAVLCWVDVELAMQAGFLGALDPALARAVVLAGLAPVFVVVGHRLKVRSWVSAGLAAALLVPFSAVLGTPVSAWTVCWWASACAAAALLAWAELRLLPATSRRLGVRFGPERRALRAVLAAGLPLALVISLLPSELPGLTRWGTTAALWTAFVLVAAVGGYLLRVWPWASTAVVAAPVAPVLAVAGVPAAAWSAASPLIDPVTLTVWAAWWWTAAFVLVAGIAHAGWRALPAVVRRLGDRAGGPFTTEARFLVVTRAAALPVALGVTLLAVEVPGLSRWGVTAVLWSAVVAAAVAGGLLVRVRAWVSAGVLAFPVIPALVAAALPASSAPAVPDGAIWWTLAFVVTAFAAHAARGVLPAAARRLGDRLGPSFDQEAHLLRVVRGAAFPVALLASGMAEDGAVLGGGWTTAILWSAVTLTALGGGLLLRVRAWVTAALLAAPPVPVLVAAALDLPAWDSTVWTVAFVLSGVLAWAAVRVTGPLTRLGLDVERAFVVERQLLDVVLAAALPLALLAALAATWIPAATPFGFGVMSWVTVLWAAVLAFGAIAGHALRVRAWLATAVVVAPGLAVTTLAALEPAPQSWLPALAYLVAALMTLVSRVAAAVSGPRFGTALRGEAIVSDGVGALALAVAVVLSFDVTQPEFLPGTGGTAVLFLLAAVTAAVLRRVTHHGHLLVAGGVLTVAAGVLSGTSGGDAGVGLAPLGAACAWVVLAVLTAPGVLRAARLGSVRGALAARSRDVLLTSGWAAVAVATLPALIFVFGRAVHLLLAAAAAPRADWYLPAGTASGGLPGTDGGHLAALAITGWATLGLAAAALVTLVAARLVPVDGVGRPERFVAPFLVPAAVLGAVLHPAMPVTTTLIALALVGVVLVAATAGRDVAWPRLRPVVDAVQEAWRALARAAGVLRVIGGRPVSDAEHRLTRHAALAGALAVIALIGACSWVSRPTAAAGALVVCGLVLALRGTLPRMLHPLLVGVGYVYPLVVLGVVLGWLELTFVAAVCTVSAVASLVTIVVTLSARASRAEWYVVLGVTAAPFLAGVATVVVERSWWSAGAGVAMLCLELVLVLTLRTGLPPLVRGAAAFLLLPTAGVTVTSAGGEIAEHFDLSGSPFVLPVAAMFVSAVAAGAARIGERIGARVPDGGPGLARSIRGMLERSALLTGAITVTLAYARAAAGPDIAVAVLLVLATGAGLVAREPGRRPAWILAGALVLAALWTALGSRGVDLVEAYTFPPAVGAAAVGLYLAWRLRRSTPDGEADDGAGRDRSAGAVAGRGAGEGAGDAGRAGVVRDVRAASVRNALALAVAGGVLAVVPSFLVYLTRPEPGDWRAYALVGVAFAAVAAGWLSARGVWSRGVGLWLAAFAGFASLAGVIESWRLAPLPGAWPNDRGVRSADAASYEVLGDSARYGSDELRDAASDAAGRVAEPYVPVGIPAGTASSFVTGLAWAGVAVVVLVLCVFVLRPLAGPRLTALLRGHGFVPALIVGTLAALWHMEPAWGAMITLLVVELGLLTLLVLGVRRLVAGRAMGAAPWLVWVCATVIAIAAWSPRELRVETFSAPLGVALVAAGWLAMRDWLRRQAASSDGLRAATSDGRTADGTAAIRGAAHGVPADGRHGPDVPARFLNWPVGFAGSWRTLALGVLALVGPSVLSTATDPLTVRACGVVLVALASVLAGSRLRLSAPFWLGVGTLGVEVLVVFAKLGIGISPLPWILTLVPAALVLLIIATLDERRTAASGGTAAYLRDLR